MQKGSFFNQLYADSQQPTPEVGMGATVLLYSDRRAATIVEVSEDLQRVMVQEDTATRTDQRGECEDQYYLYTRNSKGRRWIFTLRTNGKYVCRGETMTGGTKVLIGERKEYYDFTR